MSSIPHGLRIWDGGGEQILGEQDFTMRVLGFLQFRDGTVRTAPYRVDLPGVGPGVAAILTAVEGTMLLASGSSYYTALMPSVFVGDGYLEFRPLNYYEWHPYKMYFDVVLVGTK